MGEEFDETDILFPEETSDFSHAEEFRNFSNDESIRRGMESNQHGVRRSSPIDIPGRAYADGIGFHRNNVPASVISSRIFVPPHIILERRERRNMAFLVQPQTQYATNERIYATDQRMVINGRGIPPIHLPMIQGRI